MANKKVAVKDTAILATGSVVAQVITLVLTPIVTRLYAPDQFGLFATVFALSAPMVAISSLRYFDAIMLPHDEDEAIKLFQLSMLLNILCSVLLLVSVFLFSDSLAELFNMQENAGLFYAVPLFVFIMGSRRVLDTWLQRKKSYVTISSASITTSIVDRIITISLGMLGYISFWGLIVGKAAGVVSSLFLMIVRSVQSGVNVANSSGRYTKRSVAKKYSSFAKYSWSGWVMQLTMELPVLVVGAYFNPTIVGLYVLSRRVLMEPAVLVGVALSKTFYVQAAELHKKNEDISGTCSALVLMLFRLSIPPMFVFAVAAPDLFHLVFGEQWRDAGIYATFLIPAYLVGFYMQPLSRLFSVLDKQRELAVFSIIRLIGITAALFFGVFMGEVEYLFASISVVTVIIGFNRANWIFQQIGVNTGTLVKKFVLNILIGSILAGVAYVTKAYFVFDEVYMTILFAVVCSIYYAFIYQDYKTILKKSGNR